MSKPFIVLALAGPKECGKDTVADLLVTHCGFVKLAFADALRAEVSDAFAIEPLYLVRRETKEHPMSSLALSKCLSSGFVGRVLINHQDQSAAVDRDAPRSPRQIMQWWGTEYRRAQDPNYWTKQTSAQISYMMRERLANRFVITDCRFDNEAAMVRQTHGGQVWQVKRPGRDVPDGSHVSETTGEAFSPDAVIDNSDGIQQLQECVLGTFWAYDAGLGRVTVRIEH